MYDSLLPSGYIKDPEHMAVSIVYYYNIVVIVYNSNYTRRIHKTTHAIIKSSVVIYASSSKDIV